MVWDAETGKNAGEVGHDQGEKSHYSHSVAEISCSLDGQPGRESPAAVRHSSRTADICRHGRMNVAIISSFLQLL